MLLSTIFSYATDPCRLPRFRYHRACVRLRLIQRRHPGSPLGFAAGTDTVASGVVVMYPEPVESDNGLCYFGYKFYIDNCVYYSYFWIWGDIDLKIAHFTTMRAWRERMLGRFGWFWKRWYRIAAKFSRYNDGSFCLVRCVRDLVLHGYWNGYP